MLRRWRVERAAGLRLPQVNSHCLDSSGLPADGLLRLLSFNIQVGISTERYRHYLTRGWQHLLPHPGRNGNLQRIGELLADYDLVARQEVDGGSLRSGFINQVEQLALLGRFPYWYQQLNRNLGRLAQHSNGVLSRLRPNLLEDHPLPGPPGRGAILLAFGEGADALVVVVMHLALGAASARISALEATLGVRIFERSSRGVRATPTGHLLVQRGRELLADADRKIEEQRKQISGLIEQKKDYQILQARYADLQKLKNRQKSRNIVKFFTKNT